MVKYKSIVQKLQKHYPDADKVAIFTNRGKMLMFLFDSNDIDIKF